VASTSHRLLLALAATLVGLGLAEWVLRLSEDDRADTGPYVWAPGVEQQFAVPAGRMPGVGAASWFRINREGIRGASFDTDQAVRILAVGGSTTECLYLDDDLAWPARLQDLLDEETGQRHWVGNVGRSGRTADKHVLDLAHLVPGYPRIDIVVVMVGVNDLHRRLMYGEREPALPDVRVPQVRESLAERAFVEPGPPSGWRLLDKLGLGPASTASARSSNESLQDPGGELFERLRSARARAAVDLPLPDLTSALRHYELCLNAIVDEAAALDVRLVFVTQPSLWQPDPKPEHDALMWMGGLGSFIESGHSDRYYTPGALADGMRRYNERLAEVAVARGVECLDLAGVLPRDTSVYYDDVHFNENGARLVARTLADYFIAHPDAPDAAPTVARAAPEDFPVVEDLVEIRGWGPRSATVGTPFNEQPDGRSSLWVGTVGPLTDGQHVFCAGQLLPTVRTPDLASASLTADMAARLVVEAAVHPVWIVDLDTGRRQLVGELAVR